MWDAGCRMWGKSGRLKYREFGAGQKCGVTCKVQGDVLGH